MLKLFVTLLVFLPLLSFSEDSKQSPYFKEEDKGYSITFPYGWQWQRDFMGLDVFASAPVLSEKSGSLGNISIITGKLEPDVSLESFFSSNVDQLKRTLRDVTAKETGKVFVDGLEGRKFVYTHQRGDMMLKVAQYFVVKKAEGYIITCTASEPEFALYSTSFEHAVRSFKLPN